MKIYNSNYKNRNKCLNNKSQKKENRQIYKNKFNKNKRNNWR